MVLCTCAAVAAAQDPAPTREDLLRRGRAAKVAHATAYTPNWLERWLVKVENEPTTEDLFRASDGVYLRAGGITTGAGFTLGPAYRASGLLGDRVDFNARAALSVRRYWLGEVEVSLPRLAGGHLFALAFARQSEFAEEDFFGLGPESEEADRVDFLLRNTAVGGRVGVHAGPYLSIGSGVEYFTPRVGRGRDASFPSVEEVFAQDVAGLRAKPNFVRYEAFADLDYAEPAGNPRSGGRYHVAYSFYDDVREHQFRFNRVDVDLQQYVSVLKQRRVLALRAVSSFSGDTGVGQDIPFYLQRTLGGSRSLRGVRDFRFRDRHLMLFQAEYRWKIFPAVDAALFYDTGKVASRREDINLRDLESDYGIGFRFGTVNGVFLRIDAAFGGRDGAQLFIKFSDVFDGAF